MSVTADQALVKEINRTLVLDIIRRNTPISRPDVGRMVGLGKGTISNLVNALIDSEWVHETGYAQSTGGRRPAMLMFNADAATAIGIDVRVDAIHGVVTNMGGAVLCRTRQLLRAADVEHVYGQLRSVVLSLLERSPSSRYGISGIGVGFAGLVDDSGSVTYAPSFGWRNVELQARLAADFDLPVIVDNEARMGAYGEAELGTHPFATDMIYVSIGNGIGTGLIIGGKLYRGSTGFAGEAGHMVTTAEDGADTPALQSWQSMASVSALVRRAARLLDDERIATVSQVDALGILIASAEAGHENARELFSQAGRHIGVGVANLLHLLNPGQVVIGGDMARAAPWIEPAILDAIRPLVPLYEAGPLPIGFSSLGGDATVLGAASLASTPVLKGMRVVAS
jgi:predicted NBD/HSP70 family sugar kinase